MKYALLLMFLFIFGCGGQKYINHVATKAPPTINWIDSESVAVAASQATKKPILVFTPNVKCSESNEKLFSDTGVVLLINKNFVPFRDLSGNTSALAIRSANLTASGPEKCLNRDEMFSFVNMSLVLIDLFNGQMVMPDGL